MANPVYLIDAQGNRVLIVQDAQKNLRLATESNLVDANGNPYSSLNPLPVSASVVSGPNKAAGFGNLSPGFPAQIPVSPDESTQLLPPNPLRVYAHVFNNSGTTCFLQWSAAAVLGTGIKLNPNSLYTISGYELWLGSVNAISAAGTVNLDVIEGVF